MFCFECGNKCSDNAVFCGYCGAKIIKMSNQGPEKVITENVSHVSGSITGNADTFTPAFESEGVMGSDSFADVDPAEEEKRIEEEVRKEVKRRMEEEKRLREQKRLEEQKKREEQRRIEEQRRLEEQRRIEEQRWLEEQKRIEEQKRLEEQRRIEKEKRRKEIEEQKKNIQIKRVELDEKRKKLNEELNSLDSEDKELAAKERGLEHILEEASEVVHDDSHEQKSQEFNPEFDSVDDMNYDDSSDSVFEDDDSRDEVDEEKSYSTNHNNELFEDNTERKLEDENNNYYGNYDKAEEYKAEKINTDNKSDGNTTAFGKNYNLIAYVVLVLVVVAFVIILIVSNAMKQNEIRNVTTEAASAPYTGLDGKNWSSLKNAVGTNYFKDDYTGFNGQIRLILDDKMIDSFEPGYYIEIVYNSGNKNIYLTYKNSEGHLCTIDPERWQDCGGDYQRAFFSYEKVKECYGNDFVKDKEKHKLALWIFDDSDYKINSIWVGTYK